jgi:hypothetical protein
VFGPIRAVAIDDEPRHLLAITTGLSGSGIPCSGYWYDRNTHDLKPQPPAGGLPYLRLVFMDLNLEEMAGTTETANLCAVVMNVLKQIISKNGGPYLLIFWTQVGIRVEGVTKMLYERLDEIPHPIAILELPKNRFLVKAPAPQDFDVALQEFYSELHSNIEDLKRAVKEAVESCPELSLVSMWESRASEASAQAINKISDYAREDVNDPLKLAESIQRVLAEIAIASAGKKSAKESPGRALDGGMIEILADQIGASVEDSNYQSVLQTAIGDAVQEKPVFQNELQMFSALNTFFHIDTEVGSAKAGDRGVVISAKSAKGELGFKPDSHLTEFLQPSTVFAERQPEMAELEREFRGSSEFVLIELGADCDHAQDSVRTRRYLVGLEIPEKFLELARYPTNQKLRSEALQLLGPWRIDNQIKYLLVSCGRYWTCQQREPLKNVKVKYRLRASLVNQLLHHYSVWSSRPGIVEFR